MVYRNPSRIMNRNLEMKKVHTVKSEEATGYTGCIVHVLSVCKCFLAKPVCSNKITQCSDR